MGATRARTAYVFPDHEKIGSLGLGSVINLPVFVSDRLLGTVNLLHEGGHCQTAVLPVLLPARLPSAVALMAAQHAPSITRAWSS